MPVPSSPILRSLLVMLGMIVMSSAQADEGTTLRITGELTYRQRTALPPDSLAVVEIRAADAPEGASVLAETRIETGGRQVPIPFTLDVERARFEPGKTYLLRGSILNGLRAGWISDPVLVDTGAKDIKLGDVLLKPYKAPPPFGLVAMSDVIGVEWRVEDIDRGGIIDSSHVTLTFGEDGRIAGRASCNSYSAGWTEKDGTLAISRAASTQMACAEALMNQEHKFLEILAAVRHLAMTADGALVLQSADGRTLKARRID